MPSNSGPIVLQVLFNCCCFKNELIQWNVFIEQSHMRGAYALGIEKWIKALKKLTIWETDSYNWLSLWKFCRTGIIRAPKEYKAGWLVSQCMGDWHFRWYWKDKLEGKNEGNQEGNSGSRSSHDDEALHTGAAMMMRLSTQEQPWWWGSPYTMDALALAISSQPEVSPVYVTVSWPFHSSSGMQNPRS